MRGIVTKQRVKNHYSIPKIYSLLTISFPCDRLVPSLTVIPAQAGILQLLQDPRLQFTHRTRRHADYALESAVEGGLRLVTDALSDSGKAVGGFA